MARQLSMKLPGTWGGRREGAGRKPARGTAGVAHVARPWHDRHHPVHVTMRVARDLPNLRELRLARVIGNALRVSSTTGFRLIHFSIQPDHLHLVVEATDRAALLGGLRSLVVRVAMRLNRELN